MMTVGAFRKAGQGFNWFKYCLRSRRLDAQLDQLMEQALEEELSPADRRLILLLLGRFDEVERMIAEEKRAKNNSDPDSNSET